MAKSDNSFRWLDSFSELIRTVVMMYARFPLSLRQVEDLLAKRGIDICHQTVRLWWNRFVPMFASKIRRKRVQAMRSFTHWRWLLDEVFVRINGERHYLWRSVDHQGEPPESFVTRKRDKASDMEFLKKAMRHHGPTKAIATDGLKSYKAALGDLNAVGKQETGRWLNNRVENSHLPFKRRKRAKPRFRQMKTLQKFSAVHAAFRNHFNQNRHLISRDRFKAHRSAALVEWKSLETWRSPPPPSMRRLETSCRWNDSTERPGRALRRGVGWR